jgi:hypothetical protein
MDYRTRPPGVSGCNACGIPYPASSKGQSDLSLVRYFDGYSASHDTYYLDACSESLLLQKVRPTSTWRARWEERDMTGFC